MFHLINENMNSTFKTFYLQAFEFLKFNKTCSNHQQRFKLKKEILKLESLKRSLLSQYRFTEANEIRKRITDLTYELER